VQEKRPMNGSLVEGYKKNPYYFFVKMSSSRRCKNQELKGLAMMEW
jgi:hypothetical protein